MDSTFSPIDLVEDFHRKFYVKINLAPVANPPESDLKHDRKCPSYKGDKK